MSIQNNDSIETVREMHLAYQKRIGLFVLNRLKEVKNKTGGVVGYTLTLNAEETEKLCREIDSDYPIA